MNKSSLARCQPTFEQPMVQAIFRKPIRMLVVHDMRLTCQIGVHVAVKLAHILNHPSAGHHLAIPFKRGIHVHHTCKSQPAMLATAPLKCNAALIVAAWRFG